ncbi:hypothetical protein N7519_007611 [Penicillium mononematosum]|uniref:Pc12g05340 protein n=2 Tax=Penicillium chrysogenum species complex TaxID=254878 RepID=B6GZ63_PENRW|nr:uncharacterized protein N7525_002008 [Penicillium rubens]XP_056567371.1 uncharacterized protein N7489_007906 [Penicillium chrysogenum]XP_057149198.1 uncharacterized protein N7519_007611 [Penicillium mononematosum]CAP80161.1 Pc12g05340 [Penicillium rubens Wisconsin 54-1255]KAF3028759.1 hypothetical protein E8E15_002959 [Penicillium rubens]KAJ5034064.1 hypothetical protein NUH16_005486 [Penicillium rubens]KAJ5237815.1 hypothetical protein N7489_007906 [Penicillium chrysogenum]KAJ5261923.1 h
MKLTFATLLVLPLVLAGSLKSVIITFPKGTPDSVVDQAKACLVASGGVITHEYNLINGFAAEAPVNALQTLSTQDTQYKPNIEEDKVVSAYGDYAAAV